MLGRLVLLFVLFACGATSGHSAAQVRPSETSALTFETGVLWQVGNDTTLPYRVVPNQLSWRSAEFFARPLADGGSIVLRHRLTMLATWVQNGPESRYVAFAGCPSLEWWDKTGRWSLFSGLGGGAGWIDSRGVPGGQGQDFTLHWFGRAGIEHLVSATMRVTGGLMFQHMSNGGQTTPNPGIDVLGFTAGFSWSF
jgi:lipid A 3-O-deacylase